MLKSFSVKREVKPVQRLVADTEAERKRVAEKSTAIVRVPRFEKPKGERATRSATNRWGNRESLFNDGWLSVPTRFLRRYASLNPPLTPGEALFVLQLMTFKWDSAAPFPSYKRIADAMGVTDKMARRYAQGLQKKGYLFRQYQERAPNKFDLTGLFEALTHTTSSSAEKRKGEYV